jgi:molybdopterin molybdotransferase
MVVDSSIQRISRLIPLRAILALVETRVAPVKGRKCASASAEGLVLTDDIVTAERPVSPIALHDGFAVAAAEIADAGPYAPVLLASLPPWVEVGEPLPAGTDALLPLDAVTQRGDRVEAIAAVAPGEGVLPAGGDAPAETVLRHAGERLRGLDCAVAAALGFAELSVRQPRIWIANGSARKTPLIDAGIAMLARFITKSGAAVHGELTELHEALARDEADAVIAIGGTGSGRADDSVRNLARLGRVEAHGIAISPGETAAFGFVGERPVLLIPGRLDAVLAAWFLIGRQLSARLAGGTVAEGSVSLALRRKVTSTIGMTELVPVRCADGFAEPLGGGYLSLAALARSDGWLAVPAESEGFAADAQVAVSPWP